MTDLLVVIPVFNEALRIRNSVERLVNFLNGKREDFNIVLSVDPSPDGSDMICDELSLQYNQVEVLHNKEKLGRGIAVRDAWYLHNARYYAFIDADLSADEIALESAFVLIKRNGYNIITGSRYQKGSMTVRPPLRKVISFGYNKIVNLIFNENISDHQCGLKIIDQVAKEILLSKTKVNSWFWDTELLVIGTKYGLKIGEIPISWTERKYERTHILRLMKDFLIHGWGLILLYKRTRLIK